MEYLLGNLAKIEEWIDNAPSPTGLRNNDDFMRFIVELMNRVLYLLRVGVALAPDEEAANKGVFKQRAIIVGHLVRMTKLYEGMLIHITERQLDLAAIFARLIFETAVRMEYLMKAKKPSFRSFILTSYKAEKEMLADLSNEAKSRPLIPIEKRMMRKMKRRLKRDDVSIAELMNNKNWRLDGKDFRKILEGLGLGLSYSYVFGSSSHFVHGDWYDISLHHLKRDGRYYQPKLTYADPDPRLACPITKVCLEALLFYLEWSKCDQDKIVTSTASRLLEVNHAVDTAHESTLGA